MRMLAATLMALIFGALVASTSRGVTVHWFERGMAPLDAAAK
jgi:hypothetical protein